MDGVPDEADTSQEKLFKAPESLKCALNIAKELHARRDDFAKTVKGLLATPPTGGIEYEAHILEQVFEDHWRELKEAMAKEVPNADDGVHTDEAFTTSTKDAVQDQGQAVPTESASSSQNATHTHTFHHAPPMCGAVHPVFSILSSFPKCRCV